LQGKGGTTGGGLLTGAERKRAEPTLSLKLEHALIRLTGQCHRPIQPQQFGFRKIRLGSGRRVARIVQDAQRCDTETQV